MLHTLVVLADRERAGPGGLALGGDPRQPDGPDGRSKGGSKGCDAGKRLNGRNRLPVVAKVFAEGGYAGKRVGWAESKTHVVLEIVRRLPWTKGFVVIRRRGVVERTFAWIRKCRRFVRDHEQLTRVAETLITIAAAETLRRWPRPFSNAL